MPIGDENSATNMYTQLVPPDPAPGLGAPPIDRSDWYSTIDTFTSIRLSQRRQRLVDDYFADLNRTGVL